MFGSKHTTMPASAAIETADVRRPGGLRQSAGVTPETTRPDALVLGSVVFL